MSLFVIALPFSYSGKFVDNQGVEGGRREPSDEAEEAEEAEEEEYGENDSDFAMPAGARKKPAAAAAAAPKTSAVTPVEKKKADPIQALIDRLNKAKIKEDGTTGFDFSGKYEYVWWTFQRNNTTYLRFDFLCFTAHPTDIRITVLGKGTHVRIAVKCPAALLHLRRLQASRDLGANELAGDSEYENGARGIDFVKKEHAGEDEVYLEQIIALPFEC